jgi:choice-of-anchor B domain-containing protein
MTQPSRLGLAAIFLFFSIWAVAQNINIAYRAKLTFPGETMANICGYAANGHEYALCGGSKGMHIVEVTNPDAPVKLVKIPGPDNLWKEIKTYKNFAYITSEGGGGVQIVDLSGLPGTTLNYQNYKGDGAIANQLNTIHALHIDTTKGYLYAYGSNLFSGGAVVLDLNTDPYNPTYVGKYDLLGYIHDGWVDNDTLYACHISAGFFSIADMSDKNNPQLLGTQATPNFFTHNSWMSKDRKTIFTTDETDDSFLTAYDITDPTDIKFLDKVQSNPGSNSVGHNTHILENYAVTAWYHDGVTIVDVTDPSNMVQVGNYDIDPNVSGGGQMGCWGVYPYLPSGNLVATIMTGNPSNAGEVWVLTPTYKRAAYLGGIVTDGSTGNPVVNAKVEIVGGDPSATEQTASTGAYQLGQGTAGTFTIRVSKVGYVTQEQQVTLTEAQSVTLNFALVPVQTVVITGTVVAANTGVPVPFAHVGVIGQANFETIADANGQFTLPDIFIGNYQVVAGAWGYAYKTLQNQNLNTNKTYNLILDKGYVDHFVFDYDWEVEGTSTQGIWGIGEPMGIIPGPGFTLVPEADMNGDIGNTCYITGNSTTNIGEDDVESGTMILTSPVMDLTTYNDPILKAALFFTSLTFNQEFIDSIRVVISNGTEEVELYRFLGNQFSWRLLNINIKPLIALTDNMRLRIECGSVA